MKTIQANIGTFLKNLRKNSSVSLDESIQCNDWVSYFKSLCNNSTTTEENIVSEKLADLEKIKRFNTYLNSPIKHNEVLSAIKQLKNKKAPGEDCIKMK